MKRNNPSEFKPMRVMPNSAELERAVLGGIICNKDGMFIASDVVTDATFYHLENKKTFQAMTRLFAKSAPIDGLTIMQELLASGDLEIVGGPAYLAGLTIYLDGRDISNLEYNCRILQQIYIRRRVIEVSVKAEHAAYDETIDPFELLEEFEAETFGIGGECVRGKQPNRIKVIADASGGLIAMIHNPGALTGITSGFPNVDRQFMGWGKGKLILLAGRPMMGKTTVTLEMALKAAEAGRLVIFYSLGDSGMLDLTEKAILMLAGIGDYDNLQDPDKQRTEQRIIEASERLADLPLIIEDITTLGSKDISTIRSSARQHVAKGAELIFIDYIQQVNVPGIAVKNERIGEAGNQIKAMAEVLQIPIIAPAQLNREVEKRGGSKRPQMSDLGESGELERVADIIIGIYRPEYYEIFEDEDGNSLRGLIELIPLKHRKTGKVKKSLFLMRDPATGRLRDDQARQVEIYGQPTATYEQKLHGSENQIINGYSPVIYGNGRNDEDLPF